MAGLAAASTRLARSAYNVANVNTPDFQARSVDAVAPSREQTSKQANAGMASPYHGEMGVSSTDLTTESMQQISAVNAFRANLAMLKADDDRTRRVLDIKA